MKALFNKSKDKNYQASLVADLDSAFSIAKEGKSARTTPFAVGKIVVAGKILLWGSFVIFVMNLPYIVLTYGGPLQINDRVIVAATTFSDLTAFLALGGVLLISTPIFFKLREEKITKWERVILSIAVLLSVFAVVSNMWAFVYQMPNPFALSNWRFHLINGASATLPPIVTYLGTHFEIISITFSYIATFFLAQSILRLEKQEQGSL